MTKVFVTGVTGYIGGDAIYEIANAHPEYQVTCLVRNSDKAASVAKDYASFKFVYGDLDSVELLEEESKKADIVLREPKINLPRRPLCDVNLSLQTLPMPATRPQSTPFSVVSPPTNHPGRASSSTPRARAS